MPHKLDSPRTKETGFNREVPLYYCAACFEPCECNDEDDDKSNCCFARCLAEEEWNYHLTRSKP